MRALLIRIAKSLNALMGKRGSLFADRYHETIVTSRSHMRAMVRYVLGNHAKHMRQIGKPAPAIDPFSSAVCRKLVAEGRSQIMREAL